MVIRKFPRKQKVSSKSDSRQGRREEERNTLLGRDRINEILSSGGGPEPMGFTRDSSMRR